MCQAPADDEGSKNTCQQCQYDDNHQHLPNAAGKAVQLLDGHKPNQQPVLTGERRVSAVQRQRLFAGKVACAVNCQKALTGCILLQHQRVFRLNRRVGRRADGDLQRQRIRGQVVRRRAEQVAAAAIVLQFRGGQFAAQVGVRQKPDADHAIYRAVGKDQRLGVGKHAARVIREAEWKARPVTIIIRRKQRVGVPRGLIGKIEKVGCFALIFKGRLPSTGGVKPRGLHKRCRGKLQRKVIIAVGIWTIRVEVAHINTGEARPVHAVIQIAAAENNIDAAELFRAHFEHQLRRNGAQKRLGRGTAGIQRIQRNRTVRQERFGLTVDVGRQRGQLLRRN